MLGLLFGSEYKEAELALQILGLGFFIHVLFGLNALTSISLGKPKINLLCLSVALVVNLILDFLLIPEHGIVGASIASFISLILSNVLFTVSIFKCSKLHPFSKSYVRTITFATVITIILFLLPINDYLNYNLFFSCFLLIIPLAGVIITKCITEEDALMIEAIERRITKNTFITDKIIKFVRS